MYTGGLVRSAGAGGLCDCLVRDTVAENDAHVEVFILLDTCCCTAHSCFLVRAISGLYGSHVGAWRASVDRRRASCSMMMSACAIHYECGMWRAPPDISGARKHCP